MEEFSGFKIPENMTIKERMRAECTRIYCNYEELDCDRACIFNQDNPKAVIAYSEWNKSATREIR